MRELKTLVFNRLMMPRLESLFLELAMMKCVNTRRRVQAQQATSAKEIATSSYGLRAGLRGSGSTDPVYDLAESTQVREQNASSVNEDMSGKSVPIEGELLDENKTYRSKVVEISKAFNPEARICDTGNGWYQHQFKSSASKRLTDLAVRYQTPNQSGHPVELERQSSTSSLTSLLDSDVDNDADSPSVAGCLDVIDADESIEQSAMAKSTHAAAQSDADLSRRQAVEALALTEQQDESPLQHTGAVAASKSAQAIHIQETTPSSLRQETSAAKDETSLAETSPMIHISLTATAASGMSTSTSQGGRSSACHSAYVPF